MSRFRQLVDILSSLLEAKHRRRDADELVLERLRNRVAERVTELTATVSDALGSVCERGGREVIASGDDQGGLDNSAGERATCPSPTDMASRPHQTTRHNTHTDTFTAHTTTTAHAAPESQSACACSVATATTPSTIHATPPLIAPMPSTHHVPLPPSHAVPLSPRPSSSTGTARGALYTATTVAAPEEGTHGSHPEPHHDHGVQGEHNSSHVQAQTSAVSSGERAEVALFRMDFEQSEERTVLRAALSVLLWLEHHRAWLPPNASPSASFRPGWVPSEGGSLISCCRSIPERIDFLAYLSKLIRMPTHQSPELLVLVVGGRGRGQCVPYFAVEAAEKGRRVAVVNLKAVIRDGPTILDSLSSMDSITPIPRSPLAPPLRPATPPVPALGSLRCGPPNRPVSMMARPTGSDSPVPAPLPTLTQTQTGEIIGVTSPAPAATGAIAMSSSSCAAAPAPSPTAAKRRLGELGTAVGSADARDPLTLPLDTAGGASQSQSQASRPFAAAARSNVLYWRDESGPCTCPGNWETVAADCDGPVSSKPRRGRDGSSDQAFRDATSGLELRLYRANFPTSRSRPKEPLDVHILSALDLLAQVHTARPNHYIVLVDASQDPQYAHSRLHDLFHESWGMADAFDSSDRLILLAVRQRFCRCHDSKHIQTAPSGWWSFSRRDLHVPFDMRAFARRHLEDLRCDQLGIIL